MVQECQPSISRWTACFEESTLEQQFRSARIDEQRKVAKIIAILYVLIPLPQIYPELNQFLSGNDNLIFVISIRLMNFIFIFMFLIFLKVTQSQRGIENSSMAFGFWIIFSSIVATVLRPDMSSSIIMTGFITSIAALYFFAPLSGGKVTILALTMTLGGGSAYIYFRQDIYDEWFRLLLWLVAINGFGYSGMISMNSNIRKLYWQQSELARQKNELEKVYKNEQLLFRQFKQFAELISHEFRNSLAIVKSKAQLIQLISEIGSAPDSGATIAIERAVNRMDHLFRQWLEGDRYSESEIKLECQPILLSDLLNEFKAEASQSHLHPIHFELASPDVELNVDPFLMRIVFHNLIDNAVKYSPRGGAINIGTSLTEDNVIITVRDNGMGVPLGKEELLFEKYYRVHHEDNIHGMGLGLYIVRRIVTLHGGTITAENDVTGGAIFNVVLPRT